MPGVDFAGTVLESDDDRSVGGVTRVTSSRPLVDADTSSHDEQDMPGNVPVMRYAADGTASRATGRDDPHPSRSRWHRVVVAPLSGFKR